MSLHPNTEMEKAAIDAAIPSFQQAAEQMGVAHLFAGWQPEHFRYLIQEVIAGFRAGMVQRAALNDEIPF